MRLTFRAQAFGPLANVEWTIPPGVSAIVGPNRVGKSTLLALPEFIRTAIRGSLNEAARDLRWCRISAQLRKTADEPL